MKRWRVRAKWGGLVASATIAAAYALSIPVLLEISRTTRSPRTYSGVGLAYGALSYTRDADSSYPPGWDVSALWLPGQFGWGVILLPSLNSGSDRIEVTIPLWIPLALVAAPTGWLLWADRLRGGARRGRCPKCGYDLAGLAGAEKGAEAAAPCPECGATR